ncbi:1,2-dihydroxy-3-keto-5-methylthiopentene dioxygenase [Marinomonas algicola]|jgi:1,2-dihydroxy-3-keto-5-methylthiopentene dioxygenase|uniref:1,2-dihydroxy-3-keto-5-methylthiopentene dioxygenase n=1 Tax=Marinomonas algicola TaxID=2773454 RepID=UPI00174B6A4D|nr:acireductone dioxygenase [Marinomonas algicola]
MSTLSKYHQDHPEICQLHTTNTNEITALLSVLDVTFERWQASFPIDSSTSNEQILEAYAKDIQAFKEAGGYQTVDVVSMHAHHPDKVAFREKFLSEHIHTEDEIRFFVNGKGLFCLHIGEYIYQILCEKEDLISVPANTPHWFDMGSEPEFTAIRLFNNQEGWVAHFTGSPIANQFPLLD